ncbi:MAG: DUF1614 domain-containing protein [Clostridiales bacterium]|nr:DUF1614 domain-containing protein [Clostridiales bacterium]
MSIGLILLIVVTLLVVFGVAQRVLDKLRLTDRQALFFVLLLFVGGLIPDIPITPQFSVNIGGALVPLGLCIYLLVKAGSGKEVARALVASALTGIAVYWMGRLLPNEPEQMQFDVNYLYGLAAGAIGYVFGRSRRGSFVAAVLGMMGADIWQAAELWNAGIAQALPLGGAGALDMIVIAGLTAVLLSELVGELIERMSRGTRRDHRREFVDGEFVEKEKGRERP